MSSERIPEIRYKSSLIFGDNDWHHVAELGQLGLADHDPLTFYVGDSELPLAIQSATSIKSNWLWRYGFASSSSGRYYGTSTGSNGSTNITALNVGVTSTSTYYTAGSTVVEEAYRTDGSTITKATVETIRFGSATSWYFTPAQSTTPDATNRAIVCKFVASYEADLPSDMYTISGRTITWNTTHPIYVLLYGKICTPY